MYSGHAWVSLYHRSQTATSRKRKSADKSTTLIPSCISSGIIFIDTLCGVAKNTTSQLASTSTLGSTKHSSVNPRRLGYKSATGLPSSPREVIRSEERRVGKGGTD